MAVITAANIFLCLLLPGQLIFLWLSPTSGRVPTVRHRLIMHSRIEGRRAIELPKLDDSSSTSDSVEDTTDNFRAPVQVSLVQDTPIVTSPTGSYRPMTYIITISQNVSLSQYVDRLRTAFDTDSEEPHLRSKVGYVYSENVMHGFSARLTAKTFDYVSRSPEVVEIVPDTTMSILPIRESITETVIPPASQPASAQSSKDSGDSFDAGAEIVIQKGTAPWNLQRISQRNKIHTNGNNPGATNYNYTYEQPDGLGTFVYILDTGARESHSDFEGRVEMSAQFGGYAMWDGNGHGTHCAGVVTGGRWGVTKRAKVRAIKVLSDEGEGASSDIIAGIQYVLEQYHASGYAPTVASLSLGGGKNAALDRVVQSAIDQGIHFVIAAGNQNGDACLSSPSSCPGANVVAASDIQDNRAPYSNWGSCVDFFAPGSNVTSTWFTSDRATARISGTSMAAPHVAGLIAYHLSERNRTTKEITDMLKATADRNAINLKQGESSEVTSSTPNHLIYNMVQ